MAASLVTLRQRFGSRKLTLAAIEAAVGREGLVELRRSYFPRWGPGQVHTATTTLRAFRRVIVEDPSEARLVKVIASADVELRVDILRS
jgi:hypothetical protein